MKRHVVICVAAILLLAVSASAEEAAKPPVNWPTFDLDFKTYFLIQSDNDFDDTEPLYDKNGQTVGYLLTTFKPGFTWQPIDWVTLRYQPKIGDNLWSRNDAEQRDPTAADMPIFQQEEIWGEVRLPKGLAIRAGYQWMKDPTHLFLHRHIGAADFSVSWADNRMFLFVGQLPDSIYEGTTAQPPSTELTLNNFAHDRTVYGVHFDIGLDKWIVTPMVYGLNDKTEIDRELNLLNPAVHAEGVVAPDTKVIVDVAGQWGLFKRGGLHGEDVSLSGYAAQLNFDGNWRPVGVRFNGLVLSGDNGDPNDLLEGGYTYSGWSRSATWYLSENELQDQYDNLDERVARQGAGLFLADLRLGWRALESLEVFGVGGYGRIIETRTLSDDATVAVEADLGLTWMPYQPYVAFTVAASGVWPGESGAMLQNTIDTAATAPIYAGHALMQLKF
jgi:hypothetical protein